MRIALRVLPLLAAIVVRTASADPSAVTPSRTVAVAPPRAGMLITAAVAVGDWRQHPYDPAAPSATISPLLEMDLRGAHLRGSRVGLAATGAALAGASLIAAAHHGNWCSGPGCGVGAALLFVAAPLLQAAAHEERCQ